MALDEVLSRLRNTHPDRNEKRANASLELPVTADGSSRVKGWCDQGGCGAGRRRRRVAADSGLRDLALTGAFSKN